MSLFRVCNRVVAFGYRTPELQAIGALPKIPPYSESLKIKVLKNGYDPVKRVPVMVSAGVHVEGVALPRPDPVDPESVVHGIQKRFGHKPPEMDSKLFKEFRDWHLEYVQRFAPIPADHEFNFEEWVQAINHPSWRKDEIREARKRFEEMKGQKDFLRKLTKVKSFIKDESYPTFKHPRPINSRTDEYKARCGPAFKAIEHVIFQDPSFIKLVPREQWPKFILEHLNKDGHIYISDYSSYEALFEELMEIELDMYRHMLQYHPEELSFVLLLAGTNFFYFKHVIGEVWRKRMSGELCTSLGNGYTTHVFHRFIVNYLYQKEVIIVQEGDDTLYISPGPIPEEYYTRLGLEVKLERVTDISVAQFCQLIFDPEDKIVVRDPVQYVCSFSWLPARFAGTKKYDMLMLTCKAMSAISQYPGHPIIQSYAWWIRRCSSFTNFQLTNFLQKTRMDSWERERLLEGVQKVFDSEISEKEKARRVPVPMNTRLLVERRFGVSVEQQIRIEKYFDSQSALHTVPASLFEEWIPTSWLSYSEWFVRTVNVADPLWERVSVGPTSAHHTGP